MNKIIGSTVRLLPAHTDHEATVVSYTPPPLLLFLFYFIDFLTQNPVFFLICQCFYVVCQVCVCAAGMAFIFFSIVIINHFIRHLFCLHNNRNTQQYHLFCSPKNNKKK